MNQNITPAPTIPARLVPSLILAAVSLLLILGSAALATARADLSQPLFAFGAIGLGLGLLWLAIKLPAPVADTPALSMGNMTVVAPAPVSGQELDLVMDDALTPRAAA